MNAALWVAASILAAGFLASGVSKLTRPRHTLIAGGFAWAEDFSAAQVKLIGIAEVAGAIGLIAPATLDVLPPLSAVASAGLALLMAAAAAVHIKRDEIRLLPVPIVLGAIAAAVAVMRLGPYSF